VSRSERTREARSPDGCELSTVKYIAVGNLRGEQKNVLVARVGDEL
jgi:hypothetical protein